MTISTILDMLKSRIWLILLLPLGSAATTMLVSMTNPVMYTARATILLDYRKPLEGELAGELLPVGMQRSYLSTQVDIIKSRPVVMKVVESLDLRASPQWNKRFRAEVKQGTVFENWITDVLFESLRVTAGTESRLIQVWYQDTNPETAADVANAFVESYRQIARQLRQDPAMETAESVEAVIATLRRELEQAENMVSTYQARMGIMATDERLDVETANLNELMRQKLAADSVRRSAETRLNVLDEMISEGKAIDSVSEVLSNALVQDLQIELARIESQLAELATSLGESHPKMRKLRAEHRSLQKNLEAEIEKIVGAVRGEWLQASRMATAVQGAETAQKQSLMELKHVRDGLQPLLRELESARASYDRALEIYSEYAMHSHLDHTNVSVLNAALPPVKPSSPGIWRNVVSALLASWMFAVGLALFWELVDRRVRGEGDIVGVGDIMCLGVLPKVR